MPKVKPGEKQADFIKRCIPIVIEDGTAKDGAQAAAICHSMWENRNKATLSRYNSTSELPQAVKDDLGPGAALALYLDVYNREYAKSENDTTAAVLAMDAVKAQYNRKGKGNWQRRTLAVARTVKPVCAGKCGRDCATCTRLYSLAEIDLASPDISPARTRTWADSAVVGSWVHPDHGALDITGAMLREFMSTFRAGVLGTDPPVDINHLSMSGLPANALDARAVGFIKDLKIATANTPVATREDGSIKYEEREHLYSLVEWTDEGWDLVSNRKFRYISPAFDTNHEDRRTGEKVGAVLLGIAVTNTPFLTGLAPIVASRVTTAARILAAKGATMQELVDLVKTLSLGFDALVTKFSGAGIAKARELAALALLMAQGKVPPDAANAPVSASDLETIGASGWAAELKAAGQESVTVEGVADADVTAATTSLKNEKPPEAAKPEEQASKPPVVAAAPPPAASPSTPTSQTVEEKSKKTTIEFTVEGEKPETVTLTREDVGSQFIELRRLRAEALESRIAAMGAANKDGYAIPPVVVDMTRAFLTRRSDSAILLAKDVTEPDVNGAILRLLSEIRDRGLVLLMQKANVPSQNGLKGKQIDALGYGPDSVPENVMLSYKRRDGAGVTGRDVCVAELMLRYINGEQKMDSRDAKLKAEREVAAVES